MSDVSFGSRKVDPNVKPSLVNDIFTASSEKYDLMNDIMSFGMHRSWKKYIIKKAKININDKILDLASGSGDLAISIAKKNIIKNKIMAVDPNESMLKIAKDRAINNGVIDRLEFRIATGEDLPFASESFDKIFLSFGFRNFTDHKRSLNEIFRVLKFGGMFLLLEFSQISNKALSSFYNFYLNNVIPITGKIIANNFDSYKYLAESIMNYYDKNRVVEMMHEAKFDNVRYINFCFGAVTLHYGFRTF